MEIAVRVECTEEEHEALKQDDAAWEALSFEAYWVVAAASAKNGIGHVFEVRNCSCGSTLLRAATR